MSGPEDLPDGWTLEPLTADDVAPEGDPEHDCTGGDDG